MKLKFLIYLFLLLSTTLINFINFANGNDEDTWMDPDAWARDHLSLVSYKSAGGNCKCLEKPTESENIETSQNEPQKHLEDVASLTYLKKFITMLFNRKHLKYESTLQVYELSVMFTLQPSQLEKLEQLQDPRDLDSILTEIFENVRIPNMYSDGQRHFTADVSTNFLSSVIQMFYNILKLTKMSEIRFLLVVILVALIAGIIKNRFKIGLPILIFGGIFVYGYLYTYLECNREMEVNHMLDILKRSKGEENIAKDSPIVKFIKRIFSGDEPQDLEHEKLKNSAKLSFGFCRPDHVLIMYLNDLFVKYLQALLLQCSSTLTSLNESFGFPYNIISGVFLIFTICYILKLTFKYMLSPSAWISFTHRKHYEPELNISTKTKAIHNEDRISGENLKLLLNAINGGASYQKTMPTVAVSGVQEIKEAIESPSQGENTEKTSVELQENNNSTKKTSDDISDVTIQDATEDS